MYIAKTKVAPHFILALKCMYKKEIVHDGLEHQIRREVEIQMNLRWVCSGRFADELSIC